MWKTLGIAESKHIKQPQQHRWIKWMSTHWKGAPQVISPKSGIKGYILNATDWRIIFGGHAAGKEGHKIMVSGGFPPKWPHLDLNILRPTVSNYHAIPP